MYDGMHAQCACKNITLMEVPTVRSRTRRKIAGAPPPFPPLLPSWCVFVKTLTVYIELPSFLHLRIRNIWYAGATVEELSGVFDTRHECEDAGCYVAVGTRLPARFHEFKTVY